MAATLLIALGVLWTVSLVLMVGLCHMAAVGDRMLPGRARLAGRRTHEFRLPN